METIVADVVVDANVIFGFGFEGGRVVLTTDGCGPPRRVKKL